MSSDKKVITTVSTYGGTHDLPVGYIRLDPITADESARRNMLEKLDRIIALLEQIAARTKQEDTP